MMTTPIFLNAVLQEKIWGEYQVYSGDDQELNHISDTVPVKSDLQQKKGLKNE